MFRRTFVHQRMEHHDQRAACLRALREVQWLPFPSAVGLPPVAKHRMTVDAEGKNKRRRQRTIRSFRRLFRDIVLPPEMEIVASGYRQQGHTRAGHTIALAV